MCHREAATSSSSSSSSKKTLLPGRRTCGCPTVSFRSSASLHYLVVILTTMTLKGRLGPPGSCALAVGLAVEEARPLFGLGWAEILLPFPTGLQMDRQSGANRVCFLAHRCFRDIMMPPSCFEGVWSVGSDVQGRAALFWIRKHKASLDPRGSARQALLTSFPAGTRTANWPTLSTSFTSASWEQMARRSWMHSSMWPARASKKEAARTGFM